MSSRSTSFKTCWIILRVFQIIFTLVVVGLVGRYLRLVSEYHASADSYLVYTQVISVLSVIIALIFVFPWSGVFIGFPLDFAMWIMWIVAFGLQMHLAGGVHCNSTWYWHNWGWYWGRPVRAFPVDFTQADVGNNGCGAMRTVWAFSFISGWLFFLSGIAGAYGFVNGRDQRGRTTAYNAEESKVEPSGDGSTAHTGLNGVNNFNTETGERV